MDYPHIVRTPDTCGGQARIEGTRITVNLVVRSVVRGRRSAEEMLIAHPHLTLAQIYAALAYYFDNQAEVDASLLKADQTEEDLRSQFPSRLVPAPSLQP